MIATFQPMPDLTSEQHEALRADIEANGIRVPITVDQHGRILDGHNRSAIAAELGVECPTTVVVVADDDEAMDAALTLNLARRHLTQEQKREIIKAELIRRPGDSDRAVARRVGCSPTTVGTVRAQRRREAEESTRRAQHELRLAMTYLFRGLHDLVLAGADPSMVLARLADARDSAAEAAYGADRVRQEAERPVVRGDGPTEAVIRQVIAHAMFSAVHNDLADVIREVEDCGVTFPLPAQMTPPQIEALLDGAFAFAGPSQLSNLDTSGVVGGGDR